MATTPIRTKRSAQPVRLLSIKTVARRLRSDSRTVSKALRRAGKQADAFTDSGLILFRADRLAALAGFLRRQKLNLQIPQ